MLNIDTEIAPQKSTAREFSFELYRYKIFTLENGLRMDTM